MKFFLSCVILAGALVATDALMCWTCENAPSLAACRSRGQLKRCRSNEQSCQDEFRRDSNQGILMFKKCKEPHACENNFIQNPRAAATPSQCNPGAPTSVCRCCCFKDGCNSFTTDCIPRTTRAEPTTTPPPESCRAPRGPKNGYVNCKDAEGRLANNRFLRGAECVFGCNTGFALKGSRRTVCRRTATGERRLSFLPKAPRCEKCTVIEETKYLKVNCDKENSVGSICKFRCTGDKVLFPPRRTQTRCKRTAIWSKKPPCCLEPCPTVDLGLILDSSSTVLFHNWQIMKEFATQVIDLFDVGPDKARVGVFRFNANVDTKTAIPLNKHVDKEALLEDVRKIPYNGTGTETGKALKYAHDIFFQEQNGDRPGSPNVLIVVTDGRGSDDEVIDKYANLLQNDGVITYAVSVVTEGATDELKAAIQTQLETIAEVVIPVERGFKALDESIAATIGSQVCSERACPVRKEAVPLLL